MKSLHLWLACFSLTGLAAGCSDGGPVNEQAAAQAENPVGAAKERSSDAVAPAPAKTKTATAQAGASSRWEKLIMHPVRDAQGALMLEVPFPAAWTLVQSAGPNAPGITGPKGLKVVDYPRQNFLFTSDPRMQQTYRQSGTRLRALPGAEQLVREDIGPWAQQRGLKFIRQYEVPEVTRADQWHNDQLFKAVPMQVRFTAIGSEWESADGEPYFILTRLSAAQSRELLTWSHYSSVLQADKAHFEAARKQFVFGLANVRHQLEYIAAYNRTEADKAGRSWAEHNARMARNQANFEAQQRDFVNRSSAAHDALMRGWRERNAASDRTQERFVDTINERTKVADPSSGQTYKVDSGYNHYWMNADGKYLSTDRQDYNPNLDDALNSQKWQELKKADY